MTERNTNEERQLQWQNHIEAWQASGLSRAQFCRDHDLSYYVFNYWHAKFKPTPPADKLVPVVVSQPSVAHSPSGTLQVRLPNGVRVSGIDSVSVDLVGRLIAQL